MCLVLAIPSNISEQNSQKLPKILESLRRAFGDVEDIMRNHLKEDNRS